MGTPEVEGPQTPRNGGAWAEADAGDPSPAMAPWSASVLLLAAFWDLLGNIVGFSPAASSSVILKDVA